MPNLTQALVSFDRPELLKFLEQCINELTILNRSNYDADNAESQLVKGNEAIHRLAGHLRDLLDADAPLTNLRVDGIIEQIDLLSTNTVERMLARFAKD